MLERDYQKYLVGALRARYPGCIVLKNDSSHIQGIPDLVVFNGPRYAMLEVKISPRAKHQANQDHYVSLFDTWSFGAFVFPENEEEVLSGLDAYFG